MNVPMGRICGAKTKSGKPCQRKPMPNGRCHKHGGPTPKGIASPNWKHGRFSKYLPQQLGEIAYNAAHDPELFNMREIIGAYEARLTYLMGLVGSGASAERFAEIAKTWGEFRKGQEMGAAGRTRMIDAAYRMDELTRDIDHDYMVWRDIDVATKNYKLLLESERKRQIEAHSLIPVVKASDFAREVLLAVRQEVTNPEEWARVQARITEIVGSYPSIVDAA
jgi:hypothetical protein